MQRDSIANTFVVAGLLCLICSTFVAATAVGLREKQNENRLIDKQKNILLAAGLVDPTKDYSNGELEKIYTDRITAVVVDLDSGEIELPPGVESAADYDQAAAAKQPATSEEIPRSEDLGQIGRRAKFATVYEVRAAGETDSKVELYVFPIRGKGLWSELKGFIALKSDLKTVSGLTYYEQGETPGLGGEVDNQKWKDQWKGKKLYAPDGELALGVAKGVSTSDNLVDGLSGATITSNGVTNMLHYWLGENGFGPFMEKLSPETAQAMSTTADSVSSLIETRGING